MNIMTGLNEPQYEAVCHKDGPLLVLAGAGSGKTRVLTCRVAKLISEGVAPWEILAVTFTNKAAQEMRNRVENLLGEHVAKSIWVHTFHTACLRILRQEIERLGYNRNFVIFDAQDQQTLVKNILKELNISDKNFTPRAVLSAVSAAKTAMISDDKYEKQASDFWSITVAKVYKEYTKRLKTNNALDFDDLLVMTVRLFTEFSDVLEKYQEQFKYILIDEYQDTNHVQYLFVNLLAAKYRNICVVGDDDQSIYSFRSADVRNILDFKKDFPEAVTVKLEQNYRSSGNILTAANEVIKNNASRHAKALWTESVDGELIKEYSAGDDRDEARFVGDEISRLVRENNYRYSDFAVLYRANAQSRSLEDAFSHRGLPYRLIGGLRFYERKEIKDMLAYLRLISNPSERVCFLRIINVPKRGLGESSIKVFMDYIEANSCSVFEGLARLEMIPGMTPRVLKAFSAFRTMFFSWVDLREQLSVSDLAEKILIDSAYLKELQEENTIESQGRIENLREFLTLTAEFDKNSDDKTLEAFLETVALVADVDNYDPDADSVILMTLHSAKGLEFPVVFLIGMEEGIFPHSRSMLENKELEEERRLCYVGITRAKERLYLTHAAQRLMYGNYMSSLSSRFLREIPSELLESMNPVAAKQEATTFGNSYDYPKTRPVTIAQSLKTPRLAVVPSNPDEITVGCKVKHPKFGLGTVVTREKVEKDTQVTVAFAGIGIKKLMLDYANLERLKE